MTKPYACFSRLTHKHPLALLSKLTHKQASSQHKEHKLPTEKHACIVKTLHSSSYYTRQPLYARSEEAMADNPAIDVRNSWNAAATALMVVFFALLGTAIVLIAVYCSRRKLEREGAGECEVRLAPMRYPGNHSKGSSLSSIRTDTTFSSTNESEVRRQQLEKYMDCGPTISDRRGMPELTVRYRNASEAEILRLPPPAYRSEPRAVFPGVQYGMGQIGRDGRVHRPESISEYLSV